MLIRPRPSLTLDAPGSARRRACSLHSRYTHHAETCHLLTPHWRRCPMARKVGQIIRRGSSTWLVRVYTGRDLETKKRTYLNQTIHGALRDAQTHLNKMRHRKIMIAGIDLYTIKMVRPERRVLLAGERPVRVSAGAPVAGPSRRQRSTGQSGASKDVAKDGSEKTSSMSVVC
jgi:hypothetical protein